ncbi:MAG: Tfp pilus assembly protein FimT/FimU [Tepidisphaerales bacterium]
MARPSHPTHAAFTLVELLLTLAIIAVLAGLATSRFDRSARHRSVDALAQLLLADLELARTASRAQERPVSLEFNSPPGNVGGWCVVGLPDGRLIVRRGWGTLPAAVTYVALSDSVGRDAESITFSSRGVPLAYGKVELSCGPVSRVIQLDAPSAAVTIVP